MSLFGLNSVCALNWFFGIKLWFDDGDLGGGCVLLNVICVAFALDLGVNCVFPYVFAHGCFPKAFAFGVNCFPYVFDLGLHGIATGVL